MNDLNINGIEAGASEPRYKIGAVARLTRIPAPTLRMWERRYGVVIARRTAKQARLYSKEDVTRLTLIKQLVDQGNAISTLANLSVEQLREVEASFDGSGRGYSSAQTRPSVVLIGEELIEKFNRSSSAARLLHIATQARSVNLFSGHSSLRAIDVAIIDLDVVDDEVMAAIAALGHHLLMRHIVVVYGRASGRALGSASPSLSFVRCPINIATLIRLCLAPAVELRAGDSQWLSGRQPAADTAKRPGNADVRDARDA